MDSRKFNSAARHAELPLMEKLMGHFEADPMIAKLKSNIAVYRNGPFITLYKDGNAALNASVGFGLYAPTLRFDALHILLNYLEAENIAVEWDAVSFAHGEAPMPRSARNSLLDPATSDIARYARLGLRESFLEISSLPSSRKNTQLFNAFLANTAIIQISPIEPTRASRRTLDEIALAAVAKALKQEPQPGS